MDGYGLLCRLPVLTQEGSVSANDAGIFTGRVYRDIIQVFGRSNGLC